MDKTEEVIKNVLAHHGVKGQRWGVRRTTPSATVTITTKKKNKVKAQGGQGVPIHSDAVAKVTVAQVKKKSGINAVSDSDLKAYANRLQLEQNVKRLEAEQKPGRAFIKGFLKEKGKRKLSMTVDEAMVKKTKQTLG